MCVSRRGAWGLKKVLGLRLVCLWECAEALEVTCRVHDQCGLREMDWEDVCEQDESIQERAVRGAVVVASRPFALPVRNDSF